MREQLEKIMKKRGYTYKELSNITGYSVGVLNKLLNGESVKKDESVKFHVILGVVRYLSPEQEESLIKEYCYNEYKKPENIKGLIEYLMTHRKFDLLQYTLDKYRDNSNKEIKQWIEYYGQLLKWKTSEMSNYEIFDYIRNTNVTCKKLFVLTKILELNNFYINRSYLVVSEMLDSVIKLVDEMDEGYLKSSYTTRINEMISVIELRSNKNVDKSREYALKVIDSNIGDIFNAFAYYTLAFTYIHQDKEKMNHYLEQSKKIYEIHDNDEFEEVADIIEKLNMIVEGNLTQPQMNKECSLGLYIEGKKTGKDSYLIASMTKFIAEGDMYMADLPKHALIENGHDPKVLNSLTCL